MPRAASRSLAVAAVVSLFATAPQALAAPAAPAATTPLRTLPLPSTPLPATPETNATRWVTVAANVRSGPGTGYPVVGGLSQGTRVTGSYTSNGWFNLGGGRFVWGDLLTSSPPSDDPPPSGQTRWTTTGINVRSGPGTQYAVVGGLSQGTRVTGTYTSNNWFNLGGGRYVAGWLLRDSPPGNPAPPAPPPPGAVTGAMILSQVSNYAGVPYLWGGATPAGFDCSGLTYYTFAQLGVSLPRTAAQQQAYTTTVSTPRPGDLVFHGYPAYHVGIYAGNNTMWDSARPGTVVQLRPIWDSGDLSYGRVPGVSA